MVMIKFDHLEVHVKDAQQSASFLLKLMGNGRFKKISDNNTYMFVSADDIHIEIKEKPAFQNAFDTSNGIGFCMPCLRMKGALNYLEKISEIQITSQVQNPDGACYFFKDYEGIDWHFKDYDIQDIYINI
jgi:hypothetical protein